MDHLCPVCNGFLSLHEECPLCSEPLDDSGRLYDYYGDYSPYREIDDAKLTNGVQDALHHHCLHLGWCPRCRQEHILAVEEWDEVTLYEYDGIR
ncbi:hypothetical protein KDJ56_04805 [Brevibacillus composti]|uniref:Uncharacterized protein n=1 Tax=Brevibacillus composti TaxID=2796470 RepID=A0A7T5EMD7_9BACL|nr:hypothetical protein [Brevibacillus composti]QQE75309.1 hypothetical protein JD108_05125 [Brevibacillus composti]QUO42336.1 hypothetical protein KDJ56_04805 [Brevibacillus composti]